MNHKLFLSPTQTLDLSIYQSWIVTVKMEVTSKHGFFQSWDAAVVQANNNDSSERPLGLRDGAISCQICGLTTILGSARMRHKLPGVIRFLLGKMFREWLAARQEPLLNGQWIRRGRGGGVGGKCDRASVSFQAWISPLRLLCRDWGASHWHTMLFREGTD